MKNYQNFTPRHKLKYRDRDSAFIAVLHFTVTVNSSIMNRANTIQ
jgi:hypothetical protein